ncbi:Inosine-uridine preferring nucleoside hydrolase [Holothuria leucospilota]|uniref:Inosine-uridine preferring nucleoside hydrolase n=1 Tax=Holothuria leucospilota TaxID=206669 RepID=A0A9Q1C240_HOLLE|nr:Inosine-uridine preferring nucleoside hydrolase [Holothuria leucospilota]
MTSKDQQNSHQLPEKIIFDTDAGVDDAHALLMLDGCSPRRIQLLAVTCVAGNVKLPQVLKNISHIFGHCSFTKVPIYGGAGRPLISKLPPGYELYHGRDGLGNTTTAMKIAQASSLDTSINAVQALINLVQQHPKEVNVCAVGPLTNLALAERLWPDFSRNLKSVCIMGGNMYGEGNVTPSAEFNFYCDPEAAHIVLHDFKCEKILITWELCKLYQLPQENYEELFRINTVKADFLSRISQQAVKVHKESLQVCDQLAAACACYPEIITKATKYPCKVSLCGETRGQVIIDRVNFWTDFPPESQTTIVEELDVILEGRRVIFIMCGIFFCCSVIFSGPFGLLYGKSSVVSIFLYASFYQG